MKKSIMCKDAPKTALPYSHAIQSGNTLYVSGQLPVDLKTGKLCEGTIEECAKQALDNLETVIKTAGTSLNNVLKVKYS